MIQNWSHQRLPGHCSRLSHLGSFVRLLSLTQPPSGCWRWGDILYSVAALSEALLSAFQGPGVAVSVLLCDPLTRR